MYGPWCVPWTNLLTAHSVTEKNTDENRSHLLEAGFPQTVLALLETYAESVNSKHPSNEPLPMSIADLKVIKTAIGVLLNASFGYGMRLYNHHAHYEQNCLFRTRQDQTGLSRSCLHHPQAFYCSVSRRCLGTHQPNHLGRRRFANFRSHRRVLELAFGPLAMGVASHH